MTLHWSRMDGCWLTNKCDVLPWYFVSTLRGWSLVHLCPPQATTYYLWPGTLDTVQKLKLTLAELLQTFPGVCFNISVIFDVGTNEWIIAMIWNWQQHAMMSRCVMLWVSTGVVRRIWRMDGEHTGRSGDTAWAGMSVSWDQWTLQHLRTLHTVMWPISSVNQSGMKLYDIFDCALQIYSNLCRTVKWHVICYATKNSTTCSSVSNFQPKVVFHVFCCLLGLFTDVDELCNDADESVKSHPHQSWTFSQVQVCLQQKENSVVCFISKYFV